MMIKQRLPLFIATWLVLAFVVPAAAAAPPAPAPTKGEKAGSITALLPIARVVRGAGAKAVTSEAKKGDDIVWNDWIKTERGGRARITLTDQSILSLGSQADLRVVKHDARSQQTALQLGYGRIRAEVSKVTRQGGSFELRTPTAVAGVIGTDFGIDSSATGGSTFICISGLVQVSNSDPNIAGSVQCAPGLTTTVTPGKPPTPPQNATPQQIQQLIQDTEPAIIMAMSPMSALPGVTVDAVMTGTKLGGIKSATISGAGVAVSLVGTPTDTAVTIHVVVAANAEPGPHAIHLSKESGADSAAVFTVLAPPNAAQGGDMKKPFIDLINVEGQTTAGGLSAYLASLQQVADQAIQQLQQSNTANVNLNGATTAFSSQISVVQNAINAATTQIGEAVNQAGASFQQQYDVAYQALLQRHPDGVPDDQFNQAVKAIFDSINGSLGNTFIAIRNNLTSLVSSANTNIAQTQQTFLNQLIAAGSVPEPRVNATERSIDLGAAFGSNGIAALDASSSKAAGTAAIMSYKWLLCDPSYKPANVGVLLPGNATAGCNALSGYQSSSADFGFQTCNLPAADYIARVIVTDSNNNSAGMDVKVHVLPATYDDPPTVVRNLAQAYMGLVPSPFLRFFDETGFSGFTALQQNIQNTFPNLSSVIINTVISQSNISCNDATVRADWDQRFRFKSDASQEIKRLEQLSTRMVRQPGSGWKIVDFQGDNGTAPPGPIVTDSATPNLSVTSVYPTYVGAASIDPPVPPGTQNFTAVVKNSGSADFSASTVVHFELHDAADAPLPNTGVDVPLPTPLAAGASVNLQAAVAVPALAVGTKFAVVANVNPALTGESKYDDNQASEGLLLGTPVKLTQVNTLSLTTNNPTTTNPTTGTVQVQVSAATNVTITLPTGMFLANVAGNTATQAATAGQTVTWTVYATTAAASGSLQNIVVTAGSIAPVSLQYAYTVIGVANYVVTAISFAGHSAPFTGTNALQVGETASVLATIMNTGNASPVGSITATAVCVPANPADTTSCQGGGNPTATVAAPAAGTSIIATLPTTFNGMTPGTFTGTVTLTTAIPQASTADDSLSLGFDVADFAVVVQNALSPQNILPGSSQNVTVQVTTFGTTAFPITVTPSGGSGITFTPPAASVNNATQTFTMAASLATPVGSFGATFVGTNHGVTHPAVEGVLVMAPQIVSTNIFLNDGSNPLAIQKGGAAQTINLKLTGAAFSGAATLTPPTSVVGFTTSINPALSVLANGTFDLTVSASTAATSIVTPLVITAQLPNTNPVLSITYTLFVKAVGLSDLQVVSAVPAVAFSAGSPLLEGMGVDYTVTVKNNGNVSSAGNALITMEMNGVPAGSATLASPVAPGASQPVTVHVVAPDFHGNTAFSGTATIKVKVAPDRSGDLNYTDNSLLTNVALANWHFAVTGAGSSSGSTLFVQTNRLPPYTNQVSFAGTIDGGVNIGGYDPALFAPSAGQTSSYITIGNFAAGGVGVFTGDVTLTNAAAQSGPYFAQVIVQMHDGPTVTAQRQATVYIDVSATSANTPVPCLTTSANNIGGGQTNPPCAPVSTPATVQVNGGLAEQVSLTVNFFCNVGIAAPSYVPCPGAADLAIHDASNTETTALGSTQNVPGGSPLLVRVAAALDANGNIQAGAASGYVVGINGVQNLTPAAVRGSSPSPDPVGVQVPLLFNVGDLNVPEAGSCTRVVPNGASSPLSLTWQTLGGFNSPSLSWQWQDSNHSAVGASPLGFSNPSGTSIFTGSSYSPALSLSVSNTSAQDGIATYYLAVTISNGTSTATKYFPFYFDLSLSQNFCGAIAAARGSGGAKGTWLRSATGIGGPIATLAPRSLAVTAAADVRISASDISFTPSMPKVGDAVQVRFRVRNDGDADAAGLPIALQINGATVASDTFDVPKGRAVLGGLTWTATPQIAQGAMSSRPTRTAVKGKVEPDAASGGDDTVLLAGGVQLQAAVVVDPQHLTRQKTAVEKFAPVAHLTLRGTGATPAGTIAATNSQRVLIELEDGACVGLRLSSGGIMPCGTADLEITIGDLAKSLLSFETMSGVGDAGTTFESARRTSRSAVQYNGQTAALAGHTYSVQLPNGKAAVVNVESVRNPAELDAKAQALFRASAARVMRGMGDSSGAAAPGDLTGGGSHATVFIVLNVQGD